MRSNFHLRGLPPHSAITYLRLFSDCGYEVYRQFAVVAAIITLSMLISAPSLADQLSMQREQARQAQLRLLCVTMFGGDFASPLGNFTFRRCLQDPESMILQRRPVYMQLHPMPLLVRPSTPLVAGASGTAAKPVGRQRLPIDHLPPAPQVVPLSRGLNRGNIVSSDGIRRYFFWAGPGNVRVKLGFKEMGVFGAPLRQALTFGFLDEHGRLLGQKSIVSESQLESAEVSGNFNKRQKLIIAVQPQRGLIQMGGYYEIEVIGPADFDRSAPDTSKVVPRDTRLVKPGVPLVAHSQMLVGGSNGLVR